MNRDDHDEPTRADGARGGDATFEAELRGLLAPLAFQPRALDLDAAAATPVTASGAEPRAVGGNPTHAVRGRRLLLAALVLLVVGGALWRLGRVGGEDLGAEPGSASNAGLALYRLGNGLGTGSAGGARELAPGARLELGVDERARIAVGGLGSVELEPGARLAVADESAREAGDAEVLLFLERGTLRASIFAAPRRFQVGTPAGLAVDLGCVYEATVEADGRTRLAVTAGSVAFETDARRVVVPAGAAVHAAPGTPPSTPVWEDAPEAFRAAVARLDLCGPGTGGGALEGVDWRTPLAAVVATQRERDALTLWHLLDHPVTEVRHGAAARLADLAPPPAGVDPGRCTERTARAALDRELWWDALGLGF